MRQVQLVRSRGGNTMECEAADGTVSLYWLPAKFSKVGPAMDGTHAQEPCSPAARSPSLCVQSEEGGKRGWRERGQEGAGKREGACLKMWGVVELVWSKNKARK